MLEGRTLLAAQGVPELVADINPGPGGGAYQPLIPGTGGDLLFDANNTLYYSDGTAAGTVPLRASLSLVAPRITQPAGGVLAGGLAVFLAQPIDASGQKQPALLPLRRDTRRDFRPGPLGHADPTAGRQCGPAICRRRRRSLLRRLRPDPW